MTAPAHGGARRVLATTLTVLAGLLVFATLILPRELGQLVPGALLRIPVEALVGVVAVLLLGHRWGRVLAVVSGAVLGLLTILKVIDMGFLEALGRPFDPVVDWAQLGAGGTFLVDTVGRAGAVASVAGVAVLAVALVVLTALAARRLAGVVTRHRRASACGVAALAAGWLILAVTGAQVVAPVPVASRSAASLAYQTAVGVPRSVADQRAFTERFTTDAFHDTPGPELLRGLRGKDVVLTFVESYGRSAIEDPAVAPLVDPVLEDGTRRLGAAGYSARSGFLTSPVAGGGSWLAHATLLSGLRISNQQHYRTLVGSDRMTLTRAFQRAAWRTVAVQPGTSSAWPEGEFYGIDQLYDAAHMGNQASVFTGFHTPDQYTLAQFERAERARPGRGPLMAEIPLVSSHWPFTPLPRILDWNRIGDGSVYDTPAGTADPGTAGPDEQDLRPAYGRSIAYSLSSLISYVETHGDDDLVLVFLGDHQPTPAVTGQGASRDVPITIVARDPKIADRISGWGWQDGLKPGPQAPVWRMEDFRDRFLTAFAR